MFAYMHICVYVYVRCVLLQGRIVDPGEGVGGKVAEKEKSASVTQQTEPWGKTAYP